METSARKRFFARLLCAGISQKELGRMLLLLQNSQNTDEFFSSPSKALLWLREANPLKYQETLDFFGSDADDKVSKVLDREDIAIILVGDSNYPEGLAEIANPPSVLFVRWTLCKNPLLAVVGPRKPSIYGENIVRKFIPDLIRAGFGIVSGGAYGIDSLAHEIALEKGGYTLAVIGTGIDVDYPLSHRKLYDRIVAAGWAVVSTFPVSMPALAYHFPIRNEVVVGFSRGVFAPEASERSGTLITTALALDANREVFTVPGDIHRASSVGTNRLIRNSLAKACLSSEDILEEFGVFELPKDVPNIKENRIHITKNQQSDAQKNILLALEKEDSLSFEAIVEYTSLDSGEALGTLSLLEISGIITQTHGKYHKK